jgi:biotin transport system substrate-specific component
VAGHADSPTLLVRSLSRTSLTLPIRIAVVALAVALTAAAAQFTMPVPLTAVPFTLTPLAVLLTGAALGSRLGALTQVMYVTAGALGLAVFSPSATLPSGWLRLVGPTGGYLMAYPLAAFATGWLAERGWDRRYATSLVAMLVGLAIIYLGGVSWLMAAFQPSLPSAIAAGIAPFVALDLLKALAAAWVLPRTWRLIGRRGN